MATSHQHNLRRCWKLIIDHVHVDDVVDYLYSDGVLDANDLEIIDKKSTQSDRTRTMLLIIARRGRKAVSSLASALRHQYDWIADNLEDSRK
jgi:hypothetical protein